MNNILVQCEYFFDSICVWLMLLGIFFYILLIYFSYSWYVNSVEFLWWLMLFNDFIYVFWMQVFFVIFGYFFYMLFLCYLLKKWWKVCVEWVGILMLIVILLLMLLQFIMLQYVNGKVENWYIFFGYDKFNILVWEFIFYLWFLLVLVVLILLGVVLFKWLMCCLVGGVLVFGDIVIMGQLMMIFFVLGVFYVLIC